MASLTANQLKTRGVSAIDDALDEAPEAVIHVRGKARYVVMSIEEYDRLREAEIYQAWQEARQAVAEGDYIIETAEEHIARVKGGSAGDDV